MGKAQPSHQIDLDSVFNTNNLIGRYVSKLLSFSKVY